MPPTSTKKTLAEIRALIEKKQYARAIELSESVLRKDASNYHAKVFIGVAAVAQQDFQLALDSYQSAIDLRPDLPLAYKGVIQTLSKHEAPENPLLLARAHFGLASRSRDRSAESFSKAADAFFALALTQSDVRDEAISVLRSARENMQRDSDSSFYDVTTYRICKLLSLTLPEHSVETVEERYNALLESPLSDVLDELSNVLCRKNDRAFYDGTAQLVIERARGSCLRNKDMSENIHVLRTLHAYDTLLQVAETDHACAYISIDERVNFAMRSVHLKPFCLKKTRAGAIFAVLLSEATNNSEMALHFASAEKPSTPTVSVAGVRKPSTGIFNSCTHALVAAFLHYTREEFKLAIEACKAGHLLATDGINLKHMHVLFTVLLAAALAGDRKYKQATREFNTVRQYAQQIDDPWLCNAANRGLIRTAIIAHGRHSRPASIALEEAASSSQNEYAVLECVWSDALSGDIEVDRMRELAEHTLRRVEESKHNIGNDDAYCWEYSILHPHLTLSRPQLAALASMRLGQMILAEEGHTEASLAAAQRHQMNAVGMMKEDADPFAQLGYIMERLAQFRNSGKMLERAVRCYERALHIYVAHPIASRQLARMYASRGNYAKAAEVARRVSDRNPKARWAFNILGWWRLSRNRFAEATVAFHAASRGRPRRSARDEDAVFGTTVGNVAHDNALLIDVDSWRGLAVSYRMQGKLGAASACLEDALKLLLRPSPMYTAGAPYDVAALITRCQVMVEAERDVLSVLSRKMVPSIANASMTIQSMLDMSMVRRLNQHEREEEHNALNGPATDYYTADALMVSAAELWLNGAYRRATQTRSQAAHVFQTWLVRHVLEQPKYNLAVLFKRLGDIWVETAGADGSADLAALISREFVADALRNAALAYARAAHLAPWDRTIRIQDLSAVLQLQAVFHQDVELARRALAVVMCAHFTNGVSDENDGDDDVDDPCLVAMALLTLASLSRDKKLSTGARNIAARAHQLSRRNARKLLLDASLALSINDNDVDDANDNVFAEAAIRATRDDPTDWRGFFAIATVRELDTRKRGWSSPYVESCQQAYAEADRLGAGPAAVRGQLRCLSKSLERRYEAMQHGDTMSECIDGDTVEDESALFADAGLCSVLSRRVGADVPKVCEDIISKCAARRDDLVRAKCIELLNTPQQKRNTSEVWAYVHMFPFVSETRDLLKSVVENQVNGNEK